jgi:hypothetical protein
MPSLENLPSLYYRARGNLGIITIQEDFSVWPNGGHLRNTTLSGPWLSNCDITVVSFSP